MRSLSFRRMLPVWVLAGLIAVLLGLLLAGVIRRPSGPDVDLDILPDLPPAVDEGEVLLAVGDIGSCDGLADDAVAGLAANLEGEIALLGDIVYPNGSASNFANCFEPAWGDLHDRLHPIPGNHEYETAGASAYFDYFGDAAGEPGEGWYAWELGSWQIVALNTNCSRVDCDAQRAWLADELVASDADCTLAMLHHPRWSSGRHGSGGPGAGLWDELVSGGVDVTLSGHDHSYERLNAEGITAFVVGTGGRSLYPLERPALDREEVQTEARTADAYGLLHLTLTDGAYAWTFLGIGASEFRDSGSGECR
jgi:alkaline phosphatase